MTNTSMIRFPRSSLVFCVVSVSRTKTPYGDFRNRIVEISNAIPTINMTMKTQSSPGKGNIIRILFTSHAKPLLGAYVSLHQKSPLSLIIWTMVILCVKRIEDMRQGFSKVRAVEKASVRLLRDGHWRTVSEKLHS